MKRLIETAEVAHDELVALLSASFPAGRMPAGGREVTYEVEEDVVGLTLSYTPAGAVTATAGPALTDEIAQQLIERINALAVGGESTVWRQVLFAALPVKGFWRDDGDTWQIRAVPEGSPTPEFLMGPHPFILEVRGTSLQEPFVSMLRGGKLLWEKQLLLGLVLQGGIVSPAHSAHHEWVLEREPDLHSVLRQPGYVIPTLPGQPNQLSDVGDLERIAEVDTGEFFRRVGIGEVRTLDLPDIFSMLVASVSALDVSSRDRFFRAAYWFNRSGAAWRLSQSLSYLSIINSIEVLTTRASGPTARFREIVERYAGKVPDRAKLYTLRSRIVHGDQILYSDGSSGWGLVPEPLEQRHLHDLAQQVARVVIIGWLLETAAVRDAL